MNRTTHLSNGIININPTTGQSCHSITISDGFVVQHDTPLPAGAMHIDLQGKYAVPGLIDSHIHLVLAATGMGEVDLQPCDSKESFQATLLQGREKTTEGQWLIGSGWSGQSLGREPDGRWIPDEIELPVLCYSGDFHTAIVNDASLHCVDIKKLQRMTGGEHVDKGIVKEDALFDGLVPFIPATSIETKLSQIHRAIQALHEQGITLVGSMERKRDIDELLVQIQKTQSIRMRLMCLDDPEDAMLNACKKIKEDEYLRITGFKSFLDGTLGSRSAKMYADWLDAEGCGTWTGHASSGSLQHWIEKVTQTGFSPVLHAIGDEAVGLALSLLQHVDPALVPRIEHAQCIAEKDISAVQGMCFCVQPLHQPDDSAIGKKALGSTRFNELHNWRRMIDAGGILSFGSDWPVAPPRPLDAMAIAINEGVTAREALVASTIHAAQSLQSKHAGHLELGAFGDITIVDQDPIQCNWQETVPSVTMTIQAGKIVFKKE